MYMLRVYTTINKCREIIYTNYDVVIERIEHYKNWKFYKFHTLAFFNGEFWIEL